MQEALRVCSRVRILILLFRVDEQVAHLCKVDKEPGKDKSGRVTVMLQGIPTTDKDD